MRTTSHIVVLCFTFGVLIHGDGRAGDEKPRPKVPILVDTDIGTYIDDAFALGLILTSPELDLRGITTIGGDAHTRALLACRFLDAVNRGSIPVAAGSPRRPKPDYRGQMQYGLRPAHKRPIKETAVEFLHQQLKAEPGKLTILTIGPLTNIAALLERHPESAKWIKRLVIMGGSIHLGYNHRPPPEVEWNIKADIKAAQRVFRSGVPILLVPLDATAHLSVDEKMRQKIFASQTVLTNHIHALYELWGEKTPVLYDALAAALCFDESFCKFENLRIDVDERGMTLAVEGKPNARVAVAVDRTRFMQATMQWLARPVLAAGDIGESATIRLTKDNRVFVQGNRLSLEQLETLMGQAKKAKSPVKKVVIRAHDDTLYGTVISVISRCGKVGVEDIRFGPRSQSPTSKAVPRSNFPRRVHVIEDYETDIERRWWLSGKLETKNVPLGSRRACRAVLCRNFDRRMGDRYAIYKAVIFNPVPGPPMGKNTRLTFRYYLKGSDSLRVQIYTLSKGYHRRLTLTKLPQGRWETATVDMTEARRPDGSGGPLSENERIDDIQFYVDPGAELVIDDIVLYDAAPDSEQRPFPQRMTFTGWFDTGKQGAEWPGDFEIVNHTPPRAWKAARSVPTPDGQAKWIRVDLRGPRPLSPRTKLRFRYFVSNAERMQIELGLAGNKQRASATVSELKSQQWTEAEVDFTAELKALAAGDAKTPKKLEVREIVFRIPKGADLIVDDLLLYEPGTPDNPKAQRP